MCTKEEQEGMVRAIKKLGWIRSTLTLLAVLLTVTLSGWALTEKISSGVNANVKEAAEQVFDQRLDAFHDEVKPEIMKEVDGKIVVHATESEKLTTEQFHKVQEDIANLDGKIDILIRRDQ